MSGPSTKSSSASNKPEDVLVRVERLRQQAEEFQRTSRKNSGRPARSSKSCTSARPKGGVMEDEWTRMMSGDRLVKFTYVDLPEGPSFLTAQIAGHDVVYSVILRQAEHPFSREGVERRFEYELRPISN